MNPKLEKVNREIEKTKVKIAQLQALLPTLEKQREELENTEIIKAFRSADVKPEDFSAFVAACKANMPGGAAPKLQHPTVQAAPQPQPTPQPTTLEDEHDEEKV